MAKNRIHMLIRSRRLAHGYFIREDIAGKSPREHRFKATLTLADEARKEKHHGFGPTPEKARVKACECAEANTKFVTINNNRQLSSSSSSSTRRAKRNQKYRMKRRMKMQEKKAQATEIAKQKKAVDEDTQMESENDKCARTVWFKEEEQGRGPAEKEKLIKNFDPEIKSIICKIEII